MTVKQQPIKLNFERLVFLDELIDISNSKKTI